MARIGERFTRRWSKKKIREDQHERAAQAVRKVPGKHVTLDFNANKLQDFAALVSHAAQMHIRQTLPHRVRQKWTDGNFQHEYHISDGTRFLIWLGNGENVVKANYMMHSDCEMTKDDALHIGRALGSVLVREIQDATTGRHEMSFDSYEYERQHALPEAKKADSRPFTAWEKAEDYAPTNPEPPDIYPEWE